MTDEGIEIREARPEEIDAVLGCYEWLFAPPGSHPPGWDPAAAGERLRAALDSDRSTVLVADGGEGLVGLCTAYLDLLSVRYGLRCWVEDLAVDPDSRSRGVGAALLTRARSWAAGEGATHLELDSGEARTDAHRFYEREGPAWRSLCFAYSPLEAHPIEGADRQPHP